MEWDLALHRAATPIGPLTLDNGLSLAALDHTKDLGSKGTTGHSGSNGSGAKVRTRQKVGLYTGICRPGRFCLSGRMPLSLYI